MKRQPDGITASAAGVAGVLSAILSWLALVAWRSSGREYPQLPWLTLIPLGLYVVLVLYAAFTVRQYVLSTATRPRTTFQPTPQQARGTLVAAQAGALGGAILVGFYGANAVVHLGAIDVESVRELFIRAVVCAGAAAAVCLAGFVGQWMCRLPEGSDGDEQGPASADDDGRAYG
ncbi:MAG: DUF3180 domain-containing protein [Ornithinimicrobium sp.]